MFSGDLLPMALASLSDLSDHLRSDSPAVEIAVGASLGLLGWPIYSIIIRLAGAVVGLAIGVTGVLVVDEVRPLEDWLLPALVVSGALFALLGVWVMRRVVSAAWFLIGASLGIITAWAMQRRLAQIGLDQWTPMAQALLWAGTAPLTAVLTVWLRRWLVMGGTSALGAWLLAPHLVTLGPPALVWWSAGTAGFFALQAGLHRIAGLADGPRDEADEAEG